MTPYSQQQGAKKGKKGGKGGGGAGLEDGLLGEEGEGESQIEEEESDDDVSALVKVGN